MWIFAPKLTFWDKPNTNDHVHQQYEFFHDYLKQFWPRMIADKFGIWTVFLVCERVNADTIRKVSEILWYKNYTDRFYVLRAFGKLWLNVSCRYWPYLKYRKKINFRAISISGYYLDFRYQNPEFEEQRKIRTFLVPKNLNFRIISTIEKFEFSRNNILDTIRISDFEIPNFCHKLEKKSG